MKHNQIVSTRINNIVINCYHNAIHNGYRSILHSSTNTARQQDGSMLSRGVSNRTAMWNHTSGVIFFQNWLEYRWHCHPSLKLTIQYAFIRLSTKRREKPCNIFVPNFCCQADWYLIRIGVKFESRTKPTEGTPGTTTSPLPNSNLTLETRCFKSNAKVCERT